MTEFHEKMLTKVGKERICIDSTHGTNGYNFQLTNLLTLDEFNAGVPVACCISNRTDETIMDTFFSNIKKKNWGWLVGWF